MPQTTDPRILTNKNQAMLTVLKNTIDDMSNGDLSALRADADGNLLVADPNIPIVAGRVLVSSSSAAAVVSQDLSGVCDDANPTFEIVPNIGPAPSGQSKWMGYIQFVPPALTNADIDIKVYHYIDKGFMSYEKVLVASKTISPGIGTTEKVPFNQFDLTYDPGQIAPCNAPIGIEVTCLLTGSNTLTVSGVITIIDGLSFMPS